MLGRIPRTAKDTENEDHRPKSLHRRQLYSIRAEGKREGKRRLSELTLNLSGKRDIHTHRLNSCLYPHAARAASSISSMLVMRLRGRDDADTPSIMTTGSSLTSDITRSRQGPGRGQAAGRGQAEGRVWGGGIGGCGNPDGCPGSYAPSCYLANTPDHEPRDDISNSMKLYNNLKLKQFPTIE